MRRECCMHVRKQTVLFPALFLQVLKLTYPYQPALHDWGLESAAAQRSFFAMPAPMFYQLHPFHIIMDSQLNLLQWGAAVGRVLPDLAVGQHVRDFFRVRTGCFNKANSPLVCLFEGAACLLQQQQRRRRRQHVCLPQSHKPKRQKCQQQRRCQQHSEGCKKLRAADFPPPSPHRHSVAAAPLSLN